MLIVHYCFFFTQQIIVNHMIQYSLKSSAHVLLHLKKKKKKKKAVESIFFIGNVHYIHIVLILLWTVVFVLYLCGYFHKLRPDHSPYGLIKLTGTDISKNQPTLLFYNIMF